MPVTDPPPDHSRPGSVIAPPPGLPRARTVLLLVDVINPLDFPGADDLAPAALQAAEHLAALKEDARRRGIPSIYVNDNFGHWQSDFQGVVRHCVRAGGAAGRLARRLRPADGDLTVLKPRHSAFHETPLDLLLRHIGARQLVVTGYATDLCVQFSAMDAFVRGYRLWVPADTCAAESTGHHAAALAWMERALKCHVQPAW